MLGNMYRMCCLEQFQDVQASPVSHYTHPLLDRGFKKPSNSYNEPQLGNGIRDLCKSDA